MKSRTTQQYHHRRPMHHHHLGMKKIILPLIVTTCLHLLPTTTHAFAAWFVDRRISCFTDLAENEIIMNNKVLSHSSSREPTIHLEVSPLGKQDNNAAAPNSEYVVKFVIPAEVRASLSDVQYVLELGTVDSDPIAKFTSAPPNGGIGCDGRRSHASAGKEDSSSAAIFTINDDAKRGDRVEISGGWATGHEAVTLTEKVVVVVGQGVVVVGASNEGGGGGGGGGGINDDGHVDDEVDDALQDDEAEAELEESFLEEEREDLENEVESAEEDAIEALEEKRIQIGGGNLGSEINEEEEELIEALEENRNHVEKALDSLKEDIIEDHVKKSKARMIHEHTMKQRLEAQRLHREHHERGMKHVGEDKLEEMKRRFVKDQKDQIQKDKLDELMDMKDTLKNSMNRLKKTDKIEHDRARRDHVQRLPKAELKADMDELKQLARDKMKKLSESARLGVNELMNDPHLKKIRGRMEKGYVRGSVYNGDKGRPLPPEGRHFLVVMFAMFGMVGLVRWYLDKKRRSRKGRRTL